MPKEDNLGLAKKHCFSTGWVKTTASNVRNRAVPEGETRTSTPLQLDTDPEYRAQCVQAAQGLYNGNQAARQELAIECRVEEPEKAKQAVIYLQGIGGGGSGPSTLRRDRNNEYRVAVESMVAKGPGISMDEYKVVEAQFGLKGTQGLLRLVVADSSPDRRSCYCTYEVPPH